MTKEEFNRIMSAFIERKINIKPTAKALDEMWLMQMQFCLQAGSKLSAKTFELGLECEEPVQFFNTILSTARN